MMSGNNWLAGPQLESKIDNKEENNSERPVDALALILEKGELITDPLTDNFKSRYASASKKEKKWI